MLLNIKGCVYLIYNTINNKVYIGSSVNFLIRQKQHLSRLRSNKHHCLPLQNFVNKYGITTLEFKVLYEGEDYLSGEQYYLDNYDKRLLFNVCYNVFLPSLGRVVSEETRQKMKNKVVSEEVRKQISLNSKGRKASTETKEKLRIKGLNQRHSEETKLKIKLKAQERGNINTPKGENCSFSKLKKEEVEDIKIYVNFGYSQSFIADYYGVSQSTVSAIFNNKAWLH